MKFKLRFSIKKRGGGEDKPIHLKFPLQLQFQSLHPAKCTLDERRPTGAYEKNFQSEGMEIWLKLCGWPLAKMKKINMVWYLNEIMYKV